CIGIGHVGGGPLVPAKDMPDAVVEAMQGVVERQARVAAQTEEVLNLVGLQHAHDGLSPGHLSLHGQASLLTADDIEFRIVVNSEFIMLPRMNATLNFQWPRA